MNIQTVTYNKVSFINVTSPQALELKYLKNNFRFSPLHLDDYINRTQVPKIEAASKYTLVVLEFPYFYQNGQSGQENNLLLAGLLNIPKPPLPQIPFPAFGPTDKKKRVLGSQIDFFIGKDFLVVLQDGILSPINDVFSQCQKTLRKRAELMERGPNFLFYFLVDSLVDNCFPVINEISATIDGIDRELETSQSEKILEDISVTRRNIVVFHTMLKHLIPIFRDLEGGNYRGLNQELTPFWGNVLDHLQKIWDRLEDNKELIEGISSSNESLLTSRTNRIITLLTIFSAILLPSTLLASIYGMNIEGLPFVNTPYTFPAIAVIMTVIATIMFSFFRSRHWL